MQNTMIFNRERAIVVGLVRYGQRRSQVDDYLDELELLADTAGAEVLERVVQERTKMDPAYMLGRGKIEEVANIAKYINADIIIFDDDLSPAQVKNIENMTKLKILDRSGLILDIFAKHARTREARTQVELAQLNYFLPRLTRQWTHLSRQVGGIGVRGPGETQLEVDRRLIRKRISVLEEELERIKKQRDNRRKKRNELFKAALVGYTNAGKSTMMNALTGAGTLVRDQLFATLDSTIRNLDISEHRNMLLIDTVGFIRKLPHHLVASFKSTLEEVSEADLLLHVIDISSPDFMDQITVVEKVLEEMGVKGKPVLKVFNKIDLLEDSAIIDKLKLTDEPCVFVSAERGIYLHDLEAKVLEFAEKNTRAMELVLDSHQTRLISQLHELGDVSDIEYTEDNKTIVKLIASPANASRINRLVEQDGQKPGVMQ